MKKATAKYKIVVDKSKFGHIELPSGILAEGWVEEYSCDIDGHILRARVETRKGKDLAESNQRRSEDLQKARETMARRASSDLDRLFRVVVEAHLNGELSAYLEEVEVKAMPPLAGVELIRLRDLAKSIHRTNPKWPREKVSRVMALARLGQGPFKGEWARMNAMGPSEKDAPDAAAD